MSQALQFSGAEEFGEVHIFPVSWPCMTHIHWMGIISVYRISICTGHYIGMKRVVLQRKEW